MSGLMLFAGWFHYHKAAPKLEWFQNAESMLNHHLSVLLGLVHYLGLDTKFILEIPLINY
jgi:hypothetical protein